MTLAGIPRIVPVWIPAAAERPVVAENPPAPKQGKPIDLLALVDPQGGGVRGQWRKENGVLVSDRSQPAIVQIPFMPQGDYRVTMVAERVEGYDSIAIGLVYDGHIFSAGVDSFPDRGGFAGIEMIDGQRVFENPLRQ